MGVAPDGPFGGPRYFINGLLCRYNMIAIAVRISGCGFGLHTGCAIVVSCVRVPGGRKHVACTGRGCNSWTWANRVPAAHARNAAVLEYVHVAVTTVSVQSSPA